MVTRVILNYGHSEIVAATWVHTDRQVIKSKARESPAAQGQRVAGGRVPSSPRTEAMRAAAVQGGGQDTLAQGWFRHTLDLPCKPFPYTRAHPALTMQRKDMLRPPLRGTTAPRTALLPPSPSAWARAGLSFAIHSSNQMVEYLLPASSYS